jgi:hypothetical protein
MKNLFLKRAELKLTKPTKWVQDGVLLVLSVQTMGVSEKIAGGFQSLQRLLASMVFPYSWVEAIGFAWPSGGLRISHFSPSNPGKFL